MTRDSRRNVFRKMMVIFLCVLMVSITGCGKDTVFSGSKTANDNQFLVDFDILNTTVDSVMKLEEGDKIKTVIDIVKGRVDIIVKNDDGTIIYQGNDAESSEFILEISESGDYTFTVTGRKAKGSVHFKKS